MFRKTVLICIITAIFIGVFAPFSVCAEGHEISVSASSAVLIEAESGRVLYEKDADKRRPMASTTKIMTALVALENADINMTVKIPKEAVGIEGSSLYLIEGETLTLHELLYALMLRSANDAAMAIAIAVGGSVSDFAEMMNEKAEEMGLTDTHFDNPHGLDSESHYTTAYELALITAEALKNDVFREIVSTYKKLLPQGGVPDRRLVVNHNRLLRTYDGCIGVKTGFTKKDGRCLVSAAERDGVTLVAVTLNAPNDWSDHKKMLDHGFASVKRVKISSDGIEGYLPTVGAKTDMIKYGAVGDTSAVLPNDSGELRVVIELPRFVFAPVKNGDVIGRAVFYDGENEVVSLPIEALTDAQKRKVKKTFWQWLLGLFR
ncbi:MAG: D-alanyl-D-alanine carboxypeptidase [Clostridia bacterium]|nr:D-alanyl-D-alanine carboxypeptidase [Clostridia bacterium]